MLSQWNKGSSNFFARQLSLHYFTDADWAGNLDDRTSTSAYIVFLGANPMNWSSSKQCFVARSFIEAEYRSIASTAADLHWSRSVLTELGISLSSPPVISNIEAT